MITEQENRIRNTFFKEKGMKAYEGHIDDGDQVVWKEEYVKWLESKLHQPTVSGQSEQCLHIERVWTIDPYDQKCHKCVKCGEYGV
jgi:hypothetical protein